MAVGVVEAVLAYWAGSADLYGCFEAAVEVEPVDVESVRAGCLVDPVAHQ
jgi:hypothetical protein